MFAFVGPTGNGPVLQSSSVKSNMVLGQGQQ
jgi:hypothetical protein